ncbi:MAG: hypothetical protein ACKO96_24145 [Flammeovirgaceae bacterium]
MTTQNIPPANLQELNQTFSVEFFYHHSYSGYDYYFADVKNPLPHLFEDIFMELRWSPETQKGKIDYKYTHTDGGQNGKTVGHIVDGRVEL